MVDIAVIRQRSLLLEEYLSYLRELQSLTLDQFLRTHKNYGLAERYLHLAIEVTIDLGNHIIADLNLGEVRYSHDIPEIFFRHGNINAELRETWRKMIGFRNILVHDYADVDRSIVYDVLQNRLSDIEQLKQVFAQFL